MYVCVDDATVNNVLLEAMACGTPVIAERKGEVPEYVNSQAAILADPGDAVAVVRAILRLARSSRLQVDKGKAVRKRAEELGWKNVAAVWTSKETSCKAVQGD